MMAGKIEALEKENQAMKSTANETRVRIEENLSKWKDLNGNAEELFKDRHTSDGRTHPQHTLRKLQEGLILTSSHQSNRTHGLYIGKL